MTARRLPESEPRARSWRRRCWASRGVGLDLAVVGGRWAVASSTAWPTRVGRVHARMVRWWEPVGSELASCGGRIARKVLQGRAQHQEANRTHPVSKAELNPSSIYQILLNPFSPFSP